MGLSSPQNKQLPFIHHKTEVMLTNEDMTFPHMTFLISVMVPSEDSIDQIRKLPCRIPDE